MDPSSLPIEMSEFHFVAARITAAQICRAMGIERASASVLDALTSIMLDFLSMLGSTAAGAAEGRFAESADVSDAVLAASQCGVARPSIDNIDNRDIDELVAWIRGPIQKRMAELAKSQRANAQFLGPVEPEKEEELSHDWLQAVISRQAAMGHLDFNPSAEPDPVIYGR